jgi:hypothetical protein
MLTAYYSIAQYFTFMGDNRAGIYHAASEQLQKHTCHAIIATGEPFVLFRYAKKLSERFNIPWVADYRDGWSTNWGRVGNGWQIGTGHLPQYHQACGTVGDAIGQARHGGRTGTYARHPDSDR